MAGDIQIYPVSYFAKSPLEQFVTGATTGMDTMIKLRKSSDDLEQQLLENAKKREMANAVPTGSDQDTTTTEQKAALNKSDPGSSTGTSSGGGGDKAASTDTADTTLPPEARAFLDTIAGPESSGAYNVRWGGPGGAKTFDDYSHHPNILEPGPEGPSSAAGRYQIVGSTWDPLAAKYGFSDFQPATQDQAAWHLASDTYKDKTGRDLLADLRAGNTGQIQSALKGQWGTLNMGRYDANLDKYNQKATTMAALPTVPSYGSNLQPTAASAATLPSVPSYGPDLQPTAPAPALSAAPPVQTAALAPPAPMPPGQAQYRGGLGPNVKFNSQGVPYNPASPGGVPAGTPGAGPVITKAQADAANAAMRASGQPGMPVVPTDYIWGPGQVAPPGAGQAAPAPQAAAYAPPQQQYALAPPDTGLYGNIYGTG